jgi:hypothetical protein
MRVHQPGLVSVPLGVLLALAGGRRQPGDIGTDARVVWVGGAPGDDDARTVWEALAGGRLAGYDAVVEDVAERLFRRDLARSGAVADLAFFQSFYRVYARQILQRLDGTDVRIRESAR